jgi:tetratricopeptide (TPR) repeat protein
LLQAGSILIDYGDLNKAQARLERVLTLAKMDDQAYDKYWALLGLGDIETRRDDLEGALKYYSDGLASSVSRNPTPTMRAGSAICRCPTKGSATCKRRGAILPAR